MTYRISPAAAADLDDIVAYLVGHSPRAAANLVARMIGRWELIATQPESGAPRDDIVIGLRSLVIAPYVAFYRVDDGDILILRVLHGHREITSAHFA